MIPTHPPLEICIRGVYFLPFDVYTCFCFEGSVEGSLVLIWCWALACEVVHIFLARGELVYCILLERFMGGLCVLFLNFYVIFCGVRGVNVFDPGLYCYLQDLCSI